MIINCLITGSSGFVGSNLIKHFSTNDNIKITLLDLRVTSDIEIPDSINCVIHLVGKAHDLKNNTNQDEYYFTNYELTKRMYDAFLKSKSEIFITLSSVKAVADLANGVLTEDYIPSPITHYGISKLKAEQYILEKSIAINKKYFILRPGLIHGPGNKGNFNLLFNLMKFGIPWPLGSFHNKRSFCSIDNLSFVIEELVTRMDVDSGVYNIADDDPISTNDLIKLISDVTKKKVYILSIPKSIILFFSKIGDFLSLPFNSEKLQKLTENYLISNLKLKQAIKKDLPVKAKVGLLKTFKSFTNL